MKKISLLFTLMVVAALSLAACESGGTTERTQVPTLSQQQQTTLLPTMPLNLTTTPGGNVLSTTTPMTTTGTPEVTGTAETTTGTPAATAATTSTPAVTSPAETTGTPAATAETTGTPAASGSNGGTVLASTPSYDLTSSFNSMQVQSSDGKMIGTIAGLVAMVPQPQITSTTGSGASNSTTTTANMPAGDKIMYLAVKPDASVTLANPGDLLIPWTALPFGSNSSMSGSTGAMNTTPTAEATMSTTGTPTAEATMSTTGTPTAAATMMTTTGTPTAQAGTGSSGSSMSGSAVTLNIPFDVATGVPTMTEDQLARGDFSTSGGAIASYWNSQNVPVPQANIPATGSNGGSPVSKAHYIPAFIDQNMTTFTVVDSTGQVLGTAQDFVIDRANGTLNYVIFSATGTPVSSLSGKSVVLPVAATAWQQSAGSSTAANGPVEYQIMVNAPDSAFSNAPTIAAPTDLNLTQSNWNSQFDTYWQQYLSK